MGRDNNGATASKRLSQHIGQCGNRRVPGQDCGNDAYRLKGQDAAISLCGVDGAPENVPRQTRVILQIGFCCLDLGKRLASEATAERHHAIRDLMPAPA
ncbi:hypothetical protein D3C72_2004560 [compost metagenome]